MFGPWYGIDNCEQSNNSDYADVKPSNIHRLDLYNQGESSAA